MGHCETVNQEHVPSSRRLSLCPVMRPWGGCGSPSCQKPRSSAPHDANACTKHTTPKSREFHVPKNISRVLSCPKCQYGDGGRVPDLGAFTDLARNAARICSVGRLNTATRRATPTATSTTTSVVATSTGYLQIFRHHQLNSTRLLDPRSRKTGRHMTHVTVTDMRFESGVQVCCSMIREKPKLVTKVHKGDRGERAWLCQGTST